MYIRLNQINAKIFLKDMKNGYRKCVIDKDANKRKTVSYDATMQSMAGTGYDREWYKTYFINSFKDGQD